MNAAEIGKPVLTGPLDLVQGGRGLIYRSPVFVGGEFWGMVSTVFNSTMLFKEIFSHVEDDRFLFAVRKSATDASRHDDAI